MRMFANCARRRARGQWRSASARRCFVWWDAGGNGMHGTFHQVMSPIRRYDADGRMHVMQARLSRAAVLGYTADEFPRDARGGLDDGRFYQLLRSADELRKATRSFCGAPVRLDHGGPVIGIVGDDVAFTDPYLTGTV